MATLDIYEDILAKWHERLTGDDRIGGREIKVIYTRREPEDIEINLCPYIAYFLDRNWSDEAYGTGSYSPQSRRVNLRIGFLLMLVGQDAPSLDKALFKIGGDLLDLIREKMLFDDQKSIIIGKNIVWDFESAAVDTTTIVGAQRISVPMEQFANFN